MLKKMKKSKISAWSSCRWDVVMRTITRRWMRRTMTMVVLTCMVWCRRVWCLGGWRCLAGISGRLLQGAAADPNTGSLPIHTRPDTPTVLPRIIAENIMTVFVFFYLCIFVIFFFYLCIWQPPNPHSQCFSWKTKVRNHRHRPTDTWKPRWALLNNDHEKHVSNVPRLY